MPSSIRISGSSFSDCQAASTGGEQEREREKDGETERQRDKERERERERESKTERQVRSAGRNRGPWGTLDHRLPSLSVARRKTTL